MKSGHSPVIIIILSMSPASFFTALTGTSRHSIQCNLLFCLFQLTMQSRQLPGIGRGRPSPPMNSDSISFPTSPHQASSSEDPISPIPRKPSNIFVASQTTPPEEGIPPENVDQLVRQL